MNPIGPDTLEAIEADDERHGQQWREGPPTTPGYHWCAFACSGDNPPLIVVLTVDLDGLLERPPILFHFGDPTHHMPLQAPGPPEDE